MGASSQNSFWACFSPFPINRIVNFRNERTSKKFQFDSTSSSIYWISNSTSLIANSKHFCAEGFNIYFSLIWRLYTAQNKPSDLNERFVWFFLGLNFGVIIGVLTTYQLLGVAFLIVPKKYQWILALTTPFVRECWVWIAPKVACKTSGTKTASTKLISQHYMEIQHGVFLAVTLGGLATSESTYCILALDFLINLYNTLTIIMDGVLTKEKSKLRTFCNVTNGLKYWFHSYIYVEQEKITELVMTERNEFLIPLVYMIALLMAFYGPNAEILASIKLKIWHFQTTIDNIEESIFNIGILWLADFLSLIVSATLIWKYCEINVSKILLQIQKKLWFPMAIIEGLLMIAVSCQIILFIFVSLF